MAWFHSWWKTLLEKTKRETKPITLLSPKTHRRRLTCYYITSLTAGETPLLDASGKIIAKVSARSKSRLDMEGTGRLPDGRLLNVSSVHGRYEIMTVDFPFGKGIYNEPLVPFCSLAANMSQIKEHGLFGRKVIILHLAEFFKEYLGVDVSGEFYIHDTGGAMKACPYENGLWQNGGQFDVFVKDWETYKKICNSWSDYGEVIIMPRDVSSPKGIQETLNLLMDAGLDVDGIIGPLTEEAIRKFQERTGLYTTGEWNDATKNVAASSLNNWT